jgi:hypothetical protein
MAIKSIEWLGFYEAAAISVKSEWMKDEIVRIYNVPEEKITVVPAETSSLVKEVLKIYGRVAETNKNER